MDKQQMEKYQSDNAKLIITYDDFDVNNIKYVAGFDISFDKNDNNHACAYITIVDYHTLDIVYEDYELTILTMAYIPGLLGFREVDLYVKLFNKLMVNKPEYKPDVSLIDGCGILHHRSFGSASHLGFELGMPAIGVAKTLLMIDGLNEKIVKNDFKNKCSVKGDHVELVGKSSKVHGVALKGSDSNVPLYVSIGHKISLETSIKIVVKMCKFRIPEPIRNSDIKSKLYF